MQISYTGLTATTYMLTYSSLKGMENVHKTLLKTSPKNIDIPTVVRYELEVGIAKSKSAEKRILQLEALTAIVNILPFDIQEIRCAAEIQAKLEKKGTPIGPYDMLAAGTALSNKRRLVTHRTRTFERIDRLRIEDWFRSFAERRNVRYLTGE